MGDCRQYLTRPTGFAWEEKMTSGGSLPAHHICDFAFTYLTVVLVLLFYGKIK